MKQLQADLKPVEVESFRKLWKELGIGSKAKLSVRRIRSTVYMSRVTVSAKGKTFAMLKRLLKNGPEVTKLHLDGMFKEKKSVQ